MNRGKTVDIGVQSFEKIRARNSFYVDKTDLIREWWENGADATLITRLRESINSGRCRERIRLMRGESFEAEIEGGAQHIQLL